MKFIIMYKLTKKGVEEIKVPPQRSLETPGVSLSYRRNLILIGIASIPLCLATIYCISEIINK